MILADDVRDWLDANLLGGHVHATDLELAYSFDHRFNASRTLVYQELGVDRTGEFARWGVAFAAAGSVDVLDGPMRRKVYPNIRLASNAAITGDVAWNSALVVRQDYRRQGLARAVYAAEQQLYDAWGICEIHLEAYDDGLVVWITKFGFLPCDRGFLQESYRDWAVQQNESPQPPDDPADYPPAFLSTHQGLMLYKRVQ